MRKERRTDILQKFLEQGNSSSRSMSLSISFLKGTETSLDSEILKSPMVITKVVIRAFLLSYSNLRP